MKKGKFSDKMYIVAQCWHHNMIKATEVGSHIAADDKNDHHQNVHLVTDSSINHRALKLGSKLVSHRCS